MYGMHVCICYQHKSISLPVDDKTQEMHWPLLMYNLYFLSRSLYFFSSNDYILKITCCKYYIPGNEFRRHFKFAIQTRLIHSLPQTISNHADWEIEIHLTATLNTLTPIKESMQLFYSYYSTENWLFMPGGQMELSKWHLKKEPSRSQHAFTYFFFSSCIQKCKQCFT